MPDSYDFHFFHDYFNILLQTGYNIKHMSIIKRFSPPKKCKIGLIQFQLK